jgi:DNA-binding MarR family transcriptional regulator
MSSSAEDQAICHCLALRQATRTVTNGYDAALAPTGLRVTQFSILLTLSAGSPMTVSQLAAALVLDRTTLTRNLKPLERDVLLSTGPGEHDGRERLIALTAAGKDKLAEALPYWRDAQKAFERQVGKMKTNELRALLRSVVGSGIDEVLTR